MFTRYQQRMERDWQARMRNRPILRVVSGTPKPPPMPSAAARGSRWRPRRRGCTRRGSSRRCATIWSSCASTGCTRCASRTACWTRWRAWTHSRPDAGEYERSARGILVSDDVVAVIGSGAWTDAVQVALFRVDAAGGLTYLGTHQVRSDGGEEVPAIRPDDGWEAGVFAPVSVWAGDPRGIDPYLPAVRRWEPASADTAWTPLLDPARIYRPAGRHARGRRHHAHALTVCDPSGGRAGLPRHGGLRAAQHRAPRFAHGGVRVDHAAARPRRRGRRPRPLHALPHSAGRRRAHRRRRGRAAGGRALVRRDGGRPAARAAERRAPARGPVRRLAGIPWRCCGCRWRRLATGRGRWRTARTAAASEPGQHHLHSRFVGDWMVYGTRSGERRVRHAGAEPRLCRAPRRGG